MNPQTGIQFTIGVQSSNHLNKSHTPADLKKAIENSPNYYQSDSAPRGNIVFRDGETPIINMLKAHDLSTFLHEPGHLYLNMLRDLANESEQINQDTQTILEWLGVADFYNITNDHHEKWAEMMEVYFKTGIALHTRLQAAFERFKGWLMAIYRIFKGSVSRADLSPEIADGVDRIFATDQDIAVAREKMRILPLFANAKAAQAAGMSEADYNTYRALFDAGVRPVNRPFRIINRSIGDQRQSFPATRIENR